MSGGVQREATTALFAQVSSSFRVPHIVTSSFTAARCVRDQPEVTDVVDRGDQARLNHRPAGHHLVTVAAV
jgi:hypothetical protein